MAFHLMASDPLEEGVSLPRRESLKDLFLDALAIPAEGRDAFVDSLTQLRPEESEELRRLLAFEEGANALFDRLSREMGSLASDEQMFLPGDVVSNRFHIHRLIARGGMGEVYEAHDAELGERVALKALRPLLACDNLFVDRFHQEIRLARRLSNPHICRIHDVVRHTAPGRREIVLFAMELLDGETLAARLRRDGPMPMDAAIPTVRQMLEGLAIAHRAGVVHCDFKSGNVMLCRGTDGLRVVITDFGLAHSLSEQPGMRDLAATPAYAAPEQLKGAPPTRATDIFSLGVVLYEMLTGQLPFDRTRSMPPLPPRQLAVRIDRGWDAAILRCLALEAGERFASVEDLAQGLGLGAPARISRRLILGVAATGSVAAVTGFAIWRKATSVPAPPILAILPFEVGGSATADLNQIAGGIADRLADLFCLVPGLRVLSRTATQRAVRNNRTPSQVAAAVGANQYLHGELGMSGDKAHLRLELVQVVTSATLWSQTADLDITDLETTYRQAARAIIGVLQLSAPVPTSGVPLTSSPKAYVNYLKARFLMEQRQFAAAELALQLADEAVELDPGFAKAHALRGLSLEFLSSKDGADRAQLLAQSRDAAHVALRWDQQCAEAYVVLALNQQYWEWDRAGAETNYRKAIECNPGSPAAHQSYAKHLWGLERHGEALREIELAGSLDPLSSNIRTLRGYVLLYAQRTDEAIAQLLEVIGGEPGRPTAYIPLADAYEVRGDLGRAVEAARNGVRFTQQASFALSQLGHALATSGQDLEAREILSNLLDRYNAGRCKANEVAAVYAGWKDAAPTLDWLERGLPTRDVELSALRVSVPYRFLRDTPRFIDLLKTVKLLS